MVRHGELQHTLGALLLGQFQTSPVLEHAGLGVRVCGSLELCTRRHSRQVDFITVLHGDLCVFDRQCKGRGYRVGSSGPLHNVSAHLFGNGPVIVLVRRHLNVHIVVAGGGGDGRGGFSAALGGVQQGGLRVSTVVLIAIVGHRVLRSIVGKVFGYGRVEDGVLPD